MIIRLVKWEDTLSVSDVWSLPTFSGGGGEAGEEEVKKEKKKVSNMYTRVGDRSHENTITLVRLLEVQGSGTCQKIQFKMELICYTVTMKGT